MNCQKQRAINILLKAASKQKFLGVCDVSDVNGIDVGDGLGAIGGGFDVVDLISFMAVLFLRGCLWKTASSKVEE